MNMEALFALVVATAILGMVPGPVVAALVGRALFKGVQSTFGVLAGVFVGDLVWLLAAVSGLGYVAASYSTLFLVIKYVGALYLIYLGIGALRHAFAQNMEVKIPKEARKGAGFVTGLLVTLGNPKLVVFYVGFLPSFIDMQALAFQDAVMAAILVPTTFCFINFCWAFSASKARNLMKAQKPMRVMNMLSGGLLVGAGAFMMIEE
ncbi:putative threonine efflux protein [Candidatus Terasakiella magnetica]|uniref:Putative threonine efflux protein n=1 Tax=Candidatus Terasakiella magnetica TaxID=1867952 RepID=A0A1C3RKP0_9PROT|nr:LysE family translocator [Candidatus Terasakiella magnetica]SCA57739.1 putative threonine efflux protein [Candidatus Terasakiella magnetica]